MEVNGVSPLDSLYAEVHRQADERVGEIVPLLISKGVRVKINAINHKIYRPGSPSSYDTEYAQTRQKLMNLREVERRAQFDYTHPPIGTHYVNKSLFLRSIQGKIAKVRVRLRALAAE